MDKPTGKQTLMLVPTKEQIKLLPPFASLGLDRITVVSTAKGAERACNELASVEFCGFDTESKGIFKQGQMSDGPHLIQLANLDRAWVIQLHDFDCRAIMLQWLRSSKITKAGFGLHQDCQQMERQFGVKVEGIFELNAEFRRRGFLHDIGARAAVAVIFQQQLVKSKSTSKSNWSKRFLSESQLLYAANDAYAAAVVYDVLRAADAERRG